MMIASISAILLSLIAAASPGNPVAVETRTLNNGNLILEGIPELDPAIAADLNRYQNVRSAPFRGWTSDGDGLYVSTRFGDVAQIHQVNHPGGARRQLTFFAEPVGQVLRRPQHDTLAFTRDEGGNERSQIFLLNPTSGEYQRISDGASRNGALSWSDDGQWLAFQSTRKDGRSLDVWVMNPEQPESARLVWEANDGRSFSAAGWDHDGKRLLIQEYISATRSSIHSIDIETGERHLLKGGEEQPHSYYALGFSERDAGFFYSSNEGSGFLKLHYQSLKGGDPVVITDKIPWDLSGFSLSACRRRAVFATNEDGITRVYLLDPLTLAYQAVENLPIGLAGGFTFSPDGTKLGMTLNTARSPSDSFSLELGSDPLLYGKLIRWTQSEVGGLDTDRFSEPGLFRYGSFDGLEIPAFIYRPAGEGPHPVIINIHGGPEAQFQPGFNSTFQQWIDQLGAVVIAPNVRGSSGYGTSFLNADNGYLREDSVRDIGALLDWIAVQPELDAERVAVVGGSYGGYMVLASAVHYSDRLSAGVNVVGISNFVTFLENTEAYRRDLRRVEYGDERDPEMRAFLESISPLTHVDRIRIPLLVVQGQNDPRVPVSEAVQIVGAVRAADKAVWYLNALNEGHGFRRKENRDIYMQTVLQFFREHL
jgi:dipeptidyl aminopeptidase/acylaminoacyl peptidase